MEDMKNIDAFHSEKFVEMIFSPFSLHTYLKSAKYTKNMMKPVPVKS